jgi:protein-S-isoprenylcysteine O-methyltransferase Ste14
MAHHAPLIRHIIGLLWVAWALVWLAAAFRNKATVRRESSLTRLGYVVPLLVGGVLVGWHEVPWAWLGARLWPRTLAGASIGVSLTAAGLAWAVWARMHLGGNWSGAVTVKAGHELIRSGPYAYTRHPIYTGVLTGLLGTAIASDTVHAVLGLAIITAAFVWKLRLEEEVMSETFPDDYARYRAEVPALIPFTRLRRSAPR